MSGSAQPPPFDETKISEVLTGDWYSRTHSDTINCSDQLLAGLILGIDRSHCQSAQTERLSLEPVYFTLPIIPLRHRTQLYGWRILGYISNLHLKPTSLKSRSKGAKGNPALNAINYHRILDVIFESLRDVQNDPNGFRVTVVTPPNDHNGQPVPPHLVGKKYILRMYFPISFTVGDFEGQAHCCAFKANTGRLISFDCDCMFEASDRPDVSCCPWTKSLVEDEINRRKSICDSDDDDDDNKSTLSSDHSTSSEDTINTAQVISNLHTLCYHYVSNAFYRLSFGSDLGRNIHGASVPEDLHQLDQGLIQNAVKSLVFLIRGIGNLPCRMFDHLVGELSHQLQHQSNRDLPRTNLPHGFTNLTVFRAMSGGAPAFFVSWCLAATDGVT